MLCAIPRREIRLAKGAYNFGNRTNSAHVLERRGAQPEYVSLDMTAAQQHDPEHLKKALASLAWQRWTPKWREGYGAALSIAAGVSIVGQEGVRFEGDGHQDEETARFEVRTEGVNFDSLHFPHGLEVEGDARGGARASLTMVNCTSTGTGIMVETRSWRTAGSSEATTG